MDAMPNITKTIEGASFYASNCTYLQYLNDSLRDLGISDSATLPAFDSDEEKEAVLTTLCMCNHILSLEPLVFQVDAHKYILKQCLAGAINLLPTQQA